MDDDYYDTAHQFTVDRFRIVERSFLRQYFMLLKLASLEPRVVSGFFLHDGGGVEPISALEWSRESSQHLDYEEYVLGCMERIKDADYGRHGRVVLEVVSNAPTLN